APRPAHGLTCLAELRLPLLHHRLLVLGGDLPGARPELRDALELRPGELRLHADQVFDAPRLTQPIGGARVLVEDVAHHLELLLLQAHGVFERCLGELGRRHHAVAIEIEELSLHWGPSGLLVGTTRVTRRMYA